MQFDFETEESNVENNFSWFDLLIISMLSLELNHDNQSVLVLGGADVMVSLACFLLLNLGD